ncbi:hypothetical protein Tco_0930764 [Tanacetum coccineum]
MNGTPMEINMLVEKKYPLIKELLEKVLNLQLEAEEESTMAFELIKFIKSLLEESQLCSQHVQVPLSVLFYIEQFWNTATSKTVNSVKQIHAIIDGYVVVISESSVRSCLLFNDEDGIACLTNEEIFENLALMGYEQLSTKLTFQKDTPLSDSMLVQNQAPEGEGSTTPPEPQPTPSTSQPNVSEPLTEPLQTETPPPVFHEPQTKASFCANTPISNYISKKKKDFKIVERAITIDASLDAAHDSDNIIRNQTTTRSERVLEKPNEPPLSEGQTFGSGEGNMEYHFELTDNVPPTPHDSPLSGGNTPGSDEGRMELIEELMETCTSLTKRVLALEETKTAQDRVINRLNLRVKRLEKKRKARTPQPIDFDVLDAEQITTTRPSHVSTADQVSTARPKVSTATPSTPPTTTTVFDDEDVTMAMAQTLIKIKEVKDKGVEFRNLDEDFRHENESVEKTKKKVQGDEQMQRDAEVALRLQAKLDKELKARMDADYELVARMKQEEKEKYTIKERARLLAEFFERRKKQLASERAEEIKNKSLTKTQLRNLMMTYLKNMGGYKHSQLKGKTYEEIQGLYERQQKRIQDFTPMDSEKEAQKSGKRLKRVAGSYTIHKSPKKPKVVKSAKDVTEEEAAEYEKKKEKLRLSLKIIPNDYSEVDYKKLSRKFPIVN